MKIVSNWAALIMGNCCKKTKSGRKHTTRAALVYQSAAALFDAKGLEGFAGLPLASAQSIPVSSPALASPTPPGHPSDAQESSSSSLSESDLPINSIQSPPAMLNRPEGVPRLNLGFVAGQGELVPQIRIEEGSGTPMSKRREGGVSLSVSSSSAEVNPAGSSSVQSKLDCSAFGASSDTKSLNVDNSQAESLTGLPKLMTSRHPDLLPPTCFTVEEPLLSHAISLKLPVVHFYAHCHV